MRPDALLRALGADPRVFRAIYRAQRLILSRPRLVRLRGRKAGSDFLLYIIAFLISVSAAVFMLSARRQPVLGGGFALTLGCSFLIMVVLADHAEVLVHPGERLVLAAHPHDDRSVLLAKLAAVGRSVALLSAILFVPAALVAAFLWGRGAALAFLAGAAGAAAAVTTLGLLTAVLLVRAGGRRAMERLLPWIQGLFQLCYFLPTVAGQIFQPEKVSAGTRALLSWLLPTLWFAAPLELATGLGGPSAGRRLALAACSLALLVVAGGRVSTGLGRRLLEPEPRPAGPPSRLAVRPRGLMASFLRFEGLRLLSLLRLHLRCDWRARSEVLSLPIMTLVMLVFYARPNSHTDAWLVLSLYGWTLFLSASTLIRSQRPESLWWLLSSPIDRTRFSLATIPLLRLLMLLPTSVAVALLSLRHPTPAGGSWPLELLSFLGLLAYGDLFLLLGKVMYPDFPFSRAVAGAGATAGRRVGGFMFGALLSAAGTAAIRFCQHFGAPGIAWGCLAAVALHGPAFLWARRRTRRAAAHLDLALLG
jgi:hypothetical protein